MIGIYAQSKLKKIQFLNINLKETKVVNLHCLLLLNTEASTRENFWSILMHALVVERHIIRWLIIPQLLIMIEVAIDGILRTLNQHLVVIIFKNNYMHLILDMSRRVLLIWLLIYWKCSNMTFIIHLIPLLSCLL